MQGSFLSKRLRAQFFSTAMLWIWLWLGFCSTTVYAGTSMVWSQLDDLGSKLVNIYYVSDDTRRIQLTQDGINIAPSLHHGDHSTWIAWIKKTASKQSQLMVAKLSKTGDLIRKEVVETGQTDLYSPTIAVSGDGDNGDRVWLAWTAFDGKTEDIFASYLDTGNGSGDNVWKPVKQITPSDAFADNLPSIVKVSKQAILLSWMRSSRKQNELAQVSVSSTSWAQATRKTLGAEPDLDNDGAGKFATPKLSTLRKTDKPIMRLPQIQYKFPVQLAPLLSQAENRKKIIMGAVQSDSGLVERFRGLK